MDDISTDVVKEVLVVRHYQQRLLPRLEIAEKERELQILSHSIAIVYTPVEPDDSIQVKMICWFIQHE